jgi:excisionase family DNA binding protein
MPAELGEEENALKDTAVLISSRKAAELLGIDRATWKGITHAEGLEAVRTGKSLLWRRAEVERIAGQPLRETADAQ